MPDEKKKTTILERAGAIAAPLSGVAGWLWRHASVPLSVLCLVAVFLLGRQVGGGHGEGGADAHAAGHEGHEGHEKKETTYYCSMHPQIKQPEPGICPICNMELVPMKGNEGEDPGPRSLVLSEAARKLAEVSTSPVERKSVELQIRMVGRVDYDETRLKTIAAWVPGRIERLYADFTGKQVSKGEPLVEIYSPELYVAQKELRLALNAFETRRASMGREAAALEEALLEAAREKLRLWGLTPEQVAHIEGLEVPSERLEIPAPIGGTVVERSVTQGAYVKEGTPLLRVADLARVWVMLDAYEKDLFWLKEGQEVRLFTEAYPGMEVRGAIRFIDPFVEPRTRTARVRVEVPNETGLLKPEMFVRATALAVVMETAAGLAPSAPPQWTCSMHPHERVREPGSCRICGMDLVVMDTGRGDARTDTRPPLVIPVSAALTTGKRAVVYVAVPDRERPTYEGRTVVLGPRAGDYYVVRTGLEEGEQVVTNGAFKIDSALQILAKPSMMSMPSETPEDLTPASFHATSEAIYASYFEAWSALSGDNAEDAALGFAALHAALATVDSGGLSAAKKKRWEQLSKQLHEESMAAMEKQDIGALRRHFETVSMATLSLQKEFGHRGSGKRFEMYCPMAFENKGAAWLQESDELLNPYFGASMLRCGVTREQFNGQ